MGQLGSSLKRELNSAGKRATADARSAPSLAYLLTALEKMTKGPMSKRYPRALRVKAIAVKVPLKRLQKLFAERPVLTSSIRKLQTGIESIPGRMAGASLDHANKLKQMQKKLIRFKDRKQRKLNNIPSRVGVAFSTFTTSWVSFRVAIVAADRARLQQEQRNQQMLKLKKLGQMPVSTPRTSTKKTSFWSPLTNLFRRRRGQRAY